MAADYPTFEEFMRESVQSGSLGEMLDEWKLRASGVARDVQRLRRVRKRERNLIRKRNEVVLASCAKCNISLFLSFRMS